MQLTFTVTDPPPVPAPLHRMRPEMVPLPVTAVLVEMPFVAENVCPLGQEPVVLTVHDAYGWFAVKFVVTHDKDPLLLCT